MKVLFLAPRFNNSAGDAIYAFNLANYLIKNKVNVKVISFENSKCIFWEYDSELGKFQIAESIEFKINFITLNYYSKNIQKYLESKIEKFKPNCLHIHGIHQYFTISSSLLFQKLNIPAIMTVHDYKIICGNSGFFSDRTNMPCIRCLKGNVYHPILERCKNNSFGESLGISVQMGIWKYFNGLSPINYFHVGSQFVENMLLQNDFIREKIKYIRFPIIKSASNFKKNNEINFGYVGRFVPHKGVKIFAEAVKDFKHTIHIFGDGKEKDEVKKILKCNSSVKFHGWKKYEEIYQIIGKGSIVVVPYLAYETFCYVVLEAMVNGCCVIASNRGAISELIQNGYNGILINEPTSENFTSEIKKLLKQPEKIYSIGQEACKISSTLTSFDTHAVEMANLYSEAVKNQKLVRKQ